MSGLRLWDLHKGRLPRDHLQQHDAKAVHIALFSELPRCCIPAVGIAYVIYLCITAV
jgi:hypothetical protein